MNFPPACLLSRYRRFSRSLPRLAFLNAMIMANGFAIASMVLLCFQSGGFEATHWRVTIGAFFLLLSMFSFILGGLASTVKFTGK